MAFKMDVDRLSKDELEYEMKVRGVAPTGVVDKLRKSLRGLIILENSGKVVSGAESFDVDEELTTCTDKLVEVKGLVDNVSGRSSNSQVKKIEAKFAHLFSRIDRITPVDTTQKSKKAEVLAVLLELVSDYNSKLSSERPSFPDFHADQPRPATSVTEAPVTPSPSNLAKAVPVYKWNFKFSGQSDGLSFNAFLERVDELCKSRNLDKTQLLDSSIELFEGDALLWYRMVRREVNDWNSLIARMKQEFLPSYRSSQLWTQILQRTQGPDESIGIYVATMTSLFDRMPETVADSLRMQVLRDNILPFYQEKLALVDIHTPLELIDYCRKLEAAKAKIQDYKPPVKGQLSLEPDLDYAHPSVPQVAASGSASSSPKLCFRCHKPGHLARNCTVRTALKCFDCGTSNVTRRTCPNCNKGSGNEQRRQS